jgi:hypothetical protein
MVTLLLSSISLLFSCSLGTRLHYTIPENYTGFLVIEYGCDGGYSAINKGAEVSIVFNDAGVACVSEKYEELYPNGTSLVGSTLTRSGKSVNFVGGGPHENGGYAVVGATVLVDNSIVDNKKTVFEILWAGEQDQLIRLFKEDKYTNAQADFFERNLGVRRDGGRRITPTPKAFSP